MRDPKAAGQAADGPGGRRFWLTSPTTVGVLAVLVLALVAAGWPLAALAHLGVNDSAGVVPWWLFTPFGVVGFVVAWRKPRNPLGWCLVGLAVAGALSGDGSFYAVADYRLRHGTLPLGWVAMLAQPGWAIAIALIVLALLLFPDGKLSIPRLRWVLWLYLAFGLLWIGSAYGITLDVIAGHHIRVDSGGNLIALGDSASSPAWWNVVQNVSLVVVGPITLLLSLAGQVVSYRRSSGERRQQLKWLLGGFAAGLAGVVAAIALGDKAGFWGVAARVAILAAVFVLPTCMGVAILKYRLYDIDRIISRTLAYAIVTAVLAGVFAGLVLLATEVLPFKTPVAVAAATLAAAALFSPLRRRVQRTVDRRFNRARYDADQMVAAFAAQLKDAVDLDSVRDGLAAVVQEALEPAHMSVWIRTDEQH
jgi:hypothetical protein